MTEEIQMSQGIYVALEVKQSTVVLVVFLGKRGEKRKRDHPVILTTVTNTSPIKTIVISNGSAVLPRSQSNCLPQNIVVTIASCPTRLRWFDQYQPQPEVSINPIAVIEGMGNQSEDQASFLSSSRTSPAHELSLTIFLLHSCKDAPVKWQA